MKNSKSTESCTELMGKIHITMMIYSNEVCISIMRRHSVYVLHMIRSGMAWLASECQ